MKHEKAYDLVESHIREVGRVIDKNEELIAEYKTELTGSSYMPKRKIIYRQIKELTAATKKLRAELVELRESSTLLYSGGMSFGVVVEDVTYEHGYPVAR